MLDGEYRDGQEWQEAANQPNQEAAETRCQDFQGMTAWQGESVEQIATEATCQAPQREPD